MPENNKKYTYYNICKDWGGYKNPDIFCSFDILGK